MRKHYTKLLLLFFAGCIALTASAQDGYWSSRADKSGITTDKAVSRASFPKEFKLYSLDITPLRQKLFSIAGKNAAAKSTVITLPNADGGLEKFEVYEASNFEPALQAKFPEIRAYSGRSITNPGSTLKISIAPNGIQTMVFRTNGKPNEYIEPYSADHTVYSVFKAQRNKGAAPWLCSTPDQQLAAGLNGKVYGTENPTSNVGQLKTMRLAQSVVAEYSNFFGATSAAQVALVLAAVNATMTRTNGCYEKDLALHLNLIANTTDVFYYDPNTDPYSPGAVGAGGAWNNELQTTLTSVIGEANYDVGHLFGASGGGGNAGCIGCVCVNGSKGRGFTSPANNIPQGDDFDIDYVAHEIGHQLGANHTFSHGLEGTGVNKEVGSGITIMGYAGITSFDVAPHSIDIFHEASIQQIQTNLAGKTCPVTTPLTGINATPAVGALTNYTIPPSTPFALTGSATDADPGDVLTYCWEQDDNATTSGANSVASPTKLTGPNWLSFSPTTSPTRIMPVLATILAGNSVTGPLPGGDAGANIEALSSVSRALNFRLTVRDNRAYNSGTGAVGQTNFGNMTVTVDAATYTPFLITSQNTAVSYAAGTTQTLTWSVGNTTATPISVANVKISFSSDNGATFTTLIASTPNDGTESISIPGVTTTTGRIKVEAIGNIFFDINNAPITVTLPANAFTFSSPAPVLSGCPVPASMQTSITASFLGTFTGPVNLTASGNPGGTTVVFGSTTLSSGTPTTTVTLTGTNTLPNGSYTVTVTGTGTGVPTQNRDIVFTINPGISPVITTQPSNVSACDGGVVSFSIAASGATAYQWQVSTNGGGTWTNIAGATTTTYGFTAVTADNGKQFRCVTSNACAAITNSNAATLSIVNLNAGALAPATATVCGNPNSTLLTLNGSAGTIVRWEYSTDGGATWTNVANTTTTLTVTNITQNRIYRVLVQSVGCAPAYSVTSTLTYVATGIGAVSVTSDAGTTLCAGDPAMLTAVGLNVYNFSNPAPMTISTGAGAPASVYPSNLTVSGVPVGVPLKSVTITGLNHTWSDDLDILLQSPTGVNVVLMSDAGSSGDLINHTYTFDDAAAAGLSTAAASPSGTYKPTNNGASDTWIAPGPGAITQATPTLASFTGDPNGVWKLFVADDAFGDGGSISGGYSLSFQSTGPLSGMTYLWSPAAGLNATNTNPVAASPNTTTTYTVLVTNGSGCTGTGSITLNVNQRPAVTAQPAGTSVCANSSATFSITATGTGIGYQWQESTNGGVTWTNITNGTPYAGATTATLTINPAAAGMNNYRYRCVVSGICAPAATSNAAVLTVKALPAVTVTPTSGCGGVAGTNGLALTASGGDSYVWSPVTGLYTNAAATIAYTGTNLSTVYAAPTAFTSYTVTGTNTASGCSNTATALINYTPPAPSVTPNPVTMCLGDAPVKLKSSSSTTTTVSFASGALTLAIPDNSPAGVNHSVSVSGIPANATIADVTVALNMTHTWDGDMVFALKAPNGSILNLDYFLTATGGAGATTGFTNTRISSNGTAALSSGSNPYTGIFRADRAAGSAAPQSGPNGFIPTTQLWSDLYTPASSVNGSWTLAMYDGGPADVGTLTSWSIQFTYVLGVPATPAVWSPAAGLYSDALGNTPYVAGTAVDSVWTKPTPSGVYTYQATVQSLPPAPVVPATNFATGNGQALVTFNVRNNNTYPVTLSSISSAFLATGSTATGAFYKTSAINGAPGAISAANGWTSLGTGTVSVTAALTPQTLLGGLNLVIPAGATYGIAVQGLVGGTANISYSTLAAGTYTFSAGGCDIISGTNIGFGGTAAPAAPTFTPRGFIGSVSLIPGAVSACTSPARTVTVTVNQPVSITGQPVNASVCTDKVTSFTTTATGTATNHNWRVSTDNGNSWTDVANGGVYAGVKTATLTITAPPVSMNGYLYKDSVVGAAPCGAVRSNIARLTVNPLPTIAITASPYQRLFPGLKTTLSSTVSPAAASYTWLKNGVSVAGGTGSTLVVDVDGLGEYKLSVTDVNGCSNTSNSVLLSDSASGKVFIYPNPNNGQFQVRYYSTLNNAGLPRGLNVYDSRGKRVQTNSYAIGAPYQRMDVDLRTLGSGVYWIEVVDVNGNRLAMGRADVLR